MRRITRPNISLPTLRDLAPMVTVWMEQGGPAPPDGKWNNPDVRGALFAMHGPSCVYCQHLLPQNDRGDVEHFRPQSRYPWLKYDFDNYLLSCRTCNSAEKRQKFPLSRGAQAVLYQTRHLLAQEGRLLLNPSIDEVEHIIRVDFNRPECPFIIAASQDDAAWERARETVGFFGLNAILSIRKPRIRAINETMQWLRPPRTDKAKEEIRRRASRYQPHGMAIRNMLSELAPELIPDKDDELRWFLEELLNDIEEIYKDVGQDKDRIKRHHKRLLEICWSIAVLWKCPPALSASEIEATIQRAGWHSLVKAYFDKL